MSSAQNSGKPPVLLYNLAIQSQTVLNEMLCTHSGLLFRKSSKVLLQPTQSKIELDHRVPRKIWHRNVILLFHPPRFLSWVLGGGLNPDTRSTLIYLHNIKFWIARYVAAGTTTFMIYLLGDYIVFLFIRMMYSLTERGCCPKARFQ